MVASALTDTPRDTATATLARPGEFVELCRPRLHPVAILVKQMLEQNGIAVIVQGQHSLSMQPDLAFGGQLRILVEIEQLEYATALYKAYFENEEGTDYMAEE